MKIGLEYLYILQKEDDKIKEIENTINEIPDNINKLEIERDDKEKIIEKARKKLKENVKIREQLEKETQLKKENINKYKTQMNKATTNKEYQGFITEIKYEEDSISLIEYKIIEKMLESDEIMNEIREREAEFNEIAEDYNKKIKELHANLEYHKSKMNEEMKNKEQIRAKVPEKILKVYDNLFEKKGGKAVSFVETEFCGVCNIKIRPQLLSELISSNDIFICENCGRILLKTFEEKEEEQ